MGHPGRLAVGRRQVDGDVQIHSLFLPRERLAAGFVDHPVAQRPDQPDLLGERDEIARLHQPSLAVLPANERLHADECLGLEVHERLVVQDETLPGLDRLAQAAGHRDLLQRGIRTAAIHRMPVASAVFHRVHRNICMLEQRLGVVGVAGVEADPDARTDVDLDPLDDKRRTQDSVQRAGDRLCRTHEIDLLSRVAFEIGEEDQELVAALSRNHVHLADRAAQTRPDRLQQLITGCMPEAVVDELEVVEIDEQNGRALVCSGGPGESQLQMLQKRGPVRETGQRVVERGVGELLHRLRLDSFASGDVRDNAADQHAPVLDRAFGPHSVEHPARLAVAADEPVLDLGRLAPSKRHQGCVVRLAILRVHRRVIRRLEIHACGDRTDQGLEPDERQTFEAPVGQELHLVEHDRDRSGDPLQELGAVHLEVVT